MGQLLPGEEQDLCKSLWVRAVSSAFPAFFFFFLWGERGTPGGSSVSDNCQHGLLDTSMARELNGDPKSPSRNAHMVLVASAPLSGW